MKIKRVWHPWHIWECYPAGFYSTTPPEGMDSQSAKEAYRDFLSDLNRFERGMEKVSREWTNSCEHFLTNEQMNRIAWLGQSAMCISNGVSSAFCSGFKLLSPEQQKAANEQAAKFLERWLNEYKNTAIHKNLEGARLSPRHTGRSAKGANARQPSSFLQGDLFCNT